MSTTPTTRNTSTLSGFSRVVRFAATAILCCFGAGQGRPAAGAERMPTLDMLEQSAHEQHALRLAAMPQVEQQKRRVEEMYRKDWLGGTPEGQATLQRAVDNFALHAAQLALLDDPARPKIMWANSLPHDWHGVQWPGANWGIDNPDNLYRYLFADGASRYEIHGQRSGAGPMQQTFVLYSSIPGTDERTMEGAKVVSALSSDDITFAADGSFMITVGPDPAPPGGNHLQTSPNAKVIFIRDTLGDWATQYPNRLRVQRVAGTPAPPPKSDAELAEEAARLLLLETSYWLTFFQEENYDTPPNTILPFTGRPGGWGYFATNGFKLAEGEALVFTLDPKGSAYLEMQISDPWTVTPDHTHHTSGLNSAQAKANADGTYTFVIAPMDPGVWNWIDTQGMRLGHFIVRWQRPSDEAITVDNAVRQTDVVKIGDLKKALPPETAWVTATDRKAQLAERATSYALRLVN